MAKDTPLTYNEDIPENSPDFAEDLRTYFNRMELDPQATKRTLGIPFERSSHDAIIESTKKLIQVSRREADTDDRDSLEFQKIYDVTDFLPEKVRNDQGNLMKSLLWKITNTGQLDKIPTAVLDKHVKHLFNASGLSQNLEQINVFDHLDQNLKVTRMGEGAMPSIDSVPKEARNVQSSHYGFIDPVLTPERMRIGVDLAFARGVKKGKDGQLYKEFRNVKTGKIQYLSSKDAANSVIAFPGDLDNNDKYVPAMSQAKGIFLVPREEVQYELPDGDDMFNDITNTVPLKSGVKGMRLFMGCLSSSTYILIKRADNSLFYDEVQHYVWKEGDKAISLDDTSKQPMWRDVRGVRCNTNPIPRVQVTLNSGRVLTTTTNHAWVTMGEDGNLLEIAADKLKQGTPIPRAGAVELPCTDATTVAITHNGYQPELRTIKQIDIDFEFGWIFGLYLAEGSVHIQSRVDGSERHCPVILAALTPDIRERVSRFAARYDMHYNDTSRTYVTLPGLWLGPLFTKWGNVGSFNKHIHPDVLAMPEDFRKGVVAGYLAGDGTCTLRRSCVRVSVGTRSKKLADGITLLLTSLNIGSFSSIRMVKQRVIDDSSQALPFYRVEISAEDIKKLPLIGHPGKDERLANYTSWSGKRSRHWIPRHEALTKQAVAVSKRKENWRNYIYTDKGDKARLAERLTTEQCPWIASSVIWDTVKTIVALPPEERTYDLDLDNHVFMCGNGIFVHNSKFLRSAVPLVNREAAFVQPADKDGSSFYDKLGRHAGTVRSDKDAVVKKINKDSIVLEYADGSTETKELYNQHPYARKTFIHNTPVVQPGQAVKAGDLLASSNYTDKKGTVAAGLNLRMAYSAARGKTFEDSVVISQSAAKKLTSEHLYHEDIDEDDSVILNKAKFMQSFPGKYTKEQMQALDDNGVIKPGTVVKPGDPIYVGVKQMAPGPGNMGRGSLRMEVRTWEHDHPGVVTDIGKTKTGYSTYIRTNSPAQVGDKLSNLYGSKGVIAEVIPDEEMMRDAAGRPIDVLMSPLGIYSRTNSAQIVAAALGKIAEKTGKPYIVPGFMKDNMIEFAENEMKKHNMQDREDVYDPVSGKTIPKVFVGNLYFYKLQHMAESKAKARGEGDAYTADDEPSKGAGANSKHIGDMEWHALLSHNVPSVIKDLKLIKGRRNNDFWRAVKLGQTPAMPGNPPIYDKFKAYIKAAGVNLVEDKNKTQIFAMTNEQAKKLTGNNKLDSAETYGANSFKPIPGGLFDPDKTGSLNEGKNWAFYESPEPLVNPVMEEPIRALLGVTKKEFESIVSGEQPLQGKRGGAAIKEYLDNIDLDKTIDLAKETIRSGSKSKRDSAIKLLSYAAAMQKQGVKPSDFMMDRIPVLPPAFRPITAGGKLTMVADPNYLYKELHASIQDLQEAKALPPELQTSARKAVYDNYRALVGISDPTQEKMQQKNVGGILDQLLGKGSPKHSLYQRRVIGANIDLSGLSVATLNPSLKLNQIGLPEEEAWKVYEPFVVRKLVQSNYPAAYAAKAVQEKNPVAYQALQKVVTERPVMMNRAPTLHKYSIMAFWPVLTKGHTVQVPPAIHAPFGLDHDGDSVLTSINIEINLEELKQSLDKAKIDSTLCLDEELWLAPPTHKGEPLMLSKDATLSTVNAPIRIEDMPILPDTKVDKGNGVTEWDVPQGIKIAAIDRATGKQSTLSVTKFSKHEDCLMYDVTIGKTASKLVTVSEDHSLLVYDHETEQIELCKPADSIGKLVPCSRDLFEHDIEMFRHVSFPYTDKGEELKYGLNLSEDTGFFIGAMIGNGWIDPNYTARCAIFEPSLEKEFVRIVETLGGTPTHTESERVSLNGKTGTAKRVNCNIPRKMSMCLKAAMGSGAENKTIPWQCLSASKAHLVGLFYGLMNTDGTVSSVMGQRSGKEGWKHIVKYDTISPYLRDSFVYLCTRLGMHAGVTGYKSTSHGTQAYAIYISLPDFVRFHTKHKGTFYAENKRKAAESICKHTCMDNSSACAMDSVPYPRKAHRAMGVLNGKTAALITDATTLPLCKKQGYMSRNMAKQFVYALKHNDVSAINDAEMSVLFHWMYLVENEQVTWKPVVSAEQIGKATCYDLTVPEAYTFATSTGVFVQDTVSYSVPVSKEAVQEAIEKMMPEKNLISVRNDKVTYSPSQDYLMGLHYASKDPANEKVQRFATKEDAVQAYRKGLIRVDTPVKIG